MSYLGPFLPIYHGGLLLAVLARVLSISFMWHTELKLWEKWNLKGLFSAGCLIASETKMKDFLEKNNPKKTSMLGFEALPCMTNNNNFNN